MDPNLPGVELSGVLSNEDIATLKAYLKEAQESQEFRDTHNLPDKKYPLVDIIQSLIEQQNLDEGMQCCWDYEEALDAYDRLFPQGLQCRKMYSEEELRDIYRELVAVVQASTIPQAVEVIEWWHPENPEIILDNVQRIRKEHRLNVQQEALLNAD